MVLLRQVLDLSRIIFEGIWMIFWQVNFRMLNKIAVIFVFLSVMNVASAASVGTGGIGTAFSKGSTSVGFILGSGSAFNDNYYILGASVGYYVSRGLVHCII